MTHETKTPFYFYVKSTDSRGRDRYLQSCANFTPYWTLRIEHAMKMSKWTISAALPTDRDFDYELIPAV